MKVAYVHVTSRGDAFANAMLLALRPLTLESAAIRRYQATNAVGSLVVPLATVAGHSEKQQQQQQHQATIARTEIRLLSSTIHARSEFQLIIRLHTPQSAKRCWNQHALLQSARKNLPICVRLRQPTPAPHAIQPPLSCSCRSHDCACSPRIRSKSIAR